MILTTNGLCHATSPPMHMTSVHAVRNGVPVPTARRSLLVQKLPDITSPLTNPPHHIEEIMCRWLICLSLLVLNFLIGVRQRTRHFFSSGSEHCSRTRTCFPSSLARVDDHVVWLLPSNIMPCRPTALKSISARQYLMFSSVCNMDAWCIVVSARWWLCTSPAAVHTPLHLV